MKTIWLPANGSLLPAGHAVVQKKINNKFAYLNE
jgi:hypothetical protein